MHRALHGPPAQRPERTGRGRAVGVVSHHLRSVIDALVMTLAGVVLRGSCDEHYAANAIGCEGCGMLYTCKARSKVLQATIRMPNVIHAVSTPKHV